MMLTYHFNSPSQTLPELPRSESYHGDHTARMRLATIPALPVHLRQQQSQAICDILSYFKLQSGRGIMQRGQCLPLECWRPVYVRSEVLLKGRFHEPMDYADVRKKDGRPVKELVSVTVLIGRLTNIFFFFPFAVVTNKSGHP